jgi:hypothetical protein
VARLDDVSGMDKVFSNAPPRDEASLVRMNKEGDKLTKAKRKTLSVNFETTILEGDGVEVVRLISTRFLREKNNIQFVDWVKVRGKGMEVGKRLEDIVFD